MIVKKWIIRLCPTGQNSSHQGTEDGGERGRDTRRSRGKADGKNAGIGRNFAGSAGLKFGGNYGILKSLPGFSEGERIVP